jgi:hypothetical protein
MNSNILNVFILASVPLSLPVAAASFDGSAPMLCASTDIMECTPGNGCSRVTADSIDAPQFMRIDVAEKTISSETAGGGSQSSSIERSETVDGKLMLQGAEDGVEGVRDGLGWTVAISRDSGRMVLTASGDEVGFVIFGACTSL